DEWLAQALPAMLKAQQDTQANAGMKQALNAVFQPLAIDVQPMMDSHIHIPDKGQTLIVPEPLEQRTWKLQHAQQGGRIFNRQDTQVASLVLSLHQLVTEARIAHAKGVREERLRIRRNMHDDLGAKLLQLLHRSSDTTKPLVREAIHDLRDLLKDMEGESLSLEAATLQWQEETLQRCKDHGAELVWQVRTSTTVLGASEFSELTRMLREAVTNALKHASTTVLSITVDQPGAVLTLLIENDGVHADHAQGSVRGLEIMDSRARKLGGYCQYHKVEGRWQVTLEIPLSNTIV
ncbi:MAG: hypothetical protein MI751_05570, partial [Pseudomonadales bacterium]|nr:hypothetical protein [Pseudomonadales bacterium]